MEYPFGLRCLVLQALNLWLHKLGYWLCRAYPIYMKKTAMSDGLLLFGGEKVQLILHRLSELYIWDMDIEPSQSPANVVLVDSALVLLVLPPCYTKHRWWWHRYALEPSMEFSVPFNRYISHECHTDKSCITNTPLALLREADVMTIHTHERC